MEGKKKKKKNIGVCNQTEKSQFFYHSAKPQEKEFSVYLGKVFFL